MAPQRFVFIDALRGIACLAVVFFHAVEGNHINKLPEVIRKAAGLGDLGVPIFFVISGFVIAHSLSDRRLTPFEFLKFILRRSLRLDPPYWVAIAIAIGFSVLASVVLATRASDEFTSSQIVAHLFYAQNLLGFRNINPVFWTLCYEVQFYAIFAFLLFFNSRWSLLVALVASLAWSLKIAPDIPGLFINLWYAFLLGVIAWYGWNRSAWLPVFAAYALLIALSSAWHHDLFAAVCCCTATVILLVAKLGKLQKLLDWRWLQMLGAISYSLYLIHNPVTGAVFRIGTMLSADSATSEALWWIVSMVACLMTAFILHRTTEKPCADLASKWFGHSNSRVPSPAASGDHAPAFHS